MDQKCKAYIKVMDSKDTNENNEKAWDDYYTEAAGEVIRSFGLLTSIVITVRFQYDDLLNHFGLHRQFGIVKLLEEQHPDKSYRSNLRVLDLAAGTGLLGEELYKVGFTDMDAVDGNDGMLKVLDAKGIYKKSWRALLGKSTDPINQVEDESYDVIVMCGGFCPSHIEIQVLRQISRALKKNGVFVNGMTEQYIREVTQFHGLEDLYYQMEKEGIWKVTRLEKAAISNERPGLYHFCKKL